MQGKIFKKILGRTDKPIGRAMLCHGVKMWVNLVKDHKLSYMPYIKALGLIVSEEKIV